MNLDSASLDQQSPVIPSTPQVTFAPWVNEEFPPWDQLLSAHDVARLTRRHRLLVPILAFCRRLPKKRRYHGCVAGWLRSEIMDCLAKDIRLAEPCAVPVRHGHVESMRMQTPLPLECAGECGRPRASSKCLQRNLNKQMRAPCKPIRPRRAKGI